MPVAREYQIGMLGVSANLCATLTKTRAVLEQIIVETESAPLYEGPSFSVEHSQDNLNLHMRGGGDFCAIYRTTDLESAIFQN